MTTEQPTKTAAADHTADDEDLENSTHQAELEQVDLESDLAVTAEGEASRVTPPSPLTEAVSEIDPIEETVTVIDEAFEKWGKAASRSDAACHLLLGEIFVRSKAFDDDLNLKMRLVGKMKRHPDVAASSRFEGMTKSGAELLLTMLFGLTENRTTKSNWLRVIKGAERLASNKKLVRSVDAFVKWIGEVKFEGAYKVLPNAKPKPATLESFLDLKATDGDLPAALPDDFDLPSGYVLALMRRSETGDGGSKSEFVGYVNDEKLIVPVCRVIEKRQKAEDDEFLLDGIAASGVPALLIPESQRPRFDGRTHFEHEDEKSEFERERKAEAKRIRANPGMKTQEELAKKGRGKGKLPLDRKGEVITSLPDDVDEEQNVEPGTTPPPTLPEASPREIPSADPPTYPEIPVNSSGSESSAGELIEEEVE